MGHTGPMSDRFSSATRLIPAAPEVIFDLLADPAAHARFDGSGMVQAARPGAPERLSLGATFGMDMKLGIPYRIKNTVVEFEEGRLIGWRHMGGHVWRYRLEPVDGGTQVTEEFDWGLSHAPWLLNAIGYPERNRKAMVATLERLEQVVTAEA